MRIPFADEPRIVSRPSRNLSTEKLEIANKEFDDLLKKNFTIPNETNWSSPICLVTYADKAPRLTGDFSGKNGINDLSLTLDAELPKIAGQIVLSTARYIATLDLPKAFWQVKLHPDDVKKAQWSCSIVSVRSFVGSINFIRDWIPNLASVLEPISNLLRKTKKIIWTAETETCIKEI
ncbi:hypothetical protein GEMRC1_005834 [Eukaryota sp. GEM-RC1]